MKKVNIRMHLRRFAGTVFHVVGVGDDQPSALFHHIIDQLGYGYTGTIGRIDLIDVDHFGARHHFLHIFAGFKMSLAPTVVIVGPDEEQPKDIGFFSCRCRTVCHKHKCKKKTDDCNTVIRFFHHRISSLIVGMAKS